MLNITVSYATPEKQTEISLEVEENCTVAMAIKRSGILEKFKEITFPNIEVGIYSRKTTLDAALKNNDRIEIYRPLIIDPKQARLLRAKRNKT